MGKKIPSLSANATLQREPMDSWMSNLQLQTVALDTSRWSQASQRSSIWRTLKPRVRCVRLH